MTETQANHAAVLAAARDFGERVIEPGAEHWQDDGGVPRDYFVRAGEAALCGLLVPRAEGGSELDMGTLVAVLDRLARHCLASSFALVVHANLAGAISRHGSRAQRDQYLPGMLRGETIGAFLLTEPGVGSDAQQISTSARRDGKDWVINGIKAWITNAARADLLSVYVQTEPGSGARGIACFLVRADRPGVRRLPATELLGGRALGAGGFEFEDCRVDAKAMMHEPGTAFRAAMGGIDTARTAVAAMCCGMLERSIETAVAYVRQRSAFGGNIADQQAVRFLLADCATDLAAARALTASVVAAASGGDSTTVPAAHAKKFATRVALARIADCMQVMGAAGLLRSYPLSRHLAAAKIAQYLDGATEIQNVVIARDLIDHKR